MDQTPLSVSDAIFLVNQTLDYALPTLVVEGEIASFKVNQGKFVFCDIKDAEGTLGCFMMLFSLRQPLEDGMRVQVVATPKLTQWGKFSLTVREVRPVGEGSMKRAFELLQSKLDKEGLFAPERKRSLPLIPSRIGVISSTGAAGYKDFIKILNDRWGGVDVQVAHVRVQGSGAPQQIIRAINYFNQQAEMVEVLVMVRGGGSADDLSVFNDEPLVRTISASRIPTLVGVGHEVDVTLSDMVSDVRAATPTDAAQILVPDKREIVSQINLKLRHILLVLSGYRAKYAERVDGAVKLAYEMITKDYEQIQQRFALLQSVVAQLDPRKALKRGYALVFDASGKTLGADEPKINDELLLETINYRIKTEVKDVTRKNHK